MDDIDRAQEDNELFQRCALSKINTKRETEATGFCLWCEEQLPAGQRWCDAHCRDMWEKNRKALKNNQRFDDPVSLHSDFESAFEPEA